MVKKTILSKTCFSNTSIIIIILLIIIIIGLCYFLFDKKQDSSPVNQYNIQNSNPSEDLLHVRPNYGYTNLPNDILMNPYTAPLKDDRYLVTSSDIRGAVPINVRTQGVDTNYRQLGILTRVNKNDKKETILALLGRPLITNRCKWQYYTMETKNNIKLPIISNGRSCTNEQGCDELYEEDSIIIPEYNQSKFKIKMYDNSPRYIPY